jgi:hypothetical protein
MKLTELGHGKVKSLETACARVELRHRESAGWLDTAEYRRGVLSGIVGGDGESPSQGEGSDGSTQLVMETRAGQAGSGKHEPTFLRAIANQAKKSKDHRFRYL